MPEPKKKRLIVSFVGHQDLKHFQIDSGPPPQRGADSSPILRLLQALNDRGELGGAKLLLFDDEPASGRRKQFATALTQASQQAGLPVDIPDPVPITGHDGPTDLDGLFWAVWDKLNLPAAQRPDDIVFHVTSGTPAMHLTMMLAALCLYERSRIFETSNRPGASASEIRPPYGIALKKRSRPHASAARGLPDRARNTLLPGLVVEDAVAVAEFAALYRTAQSTKPPRVLIRGPAGSGKWWAARQFARWRGKGHAQVEWLDAASLDACPPITVKSTILIRHLDRWDEGRLHALQAWCVRNPLAAVAATWRDDRPPRVALNQVTEIGLRAAAQVCLPAFFARDDKLALAKAMAKEQGLLTTKMHARLQHQMLAPSAPKSLHELAQVLAHAASRSDSRNIEREAFDQGLQMLQAQESLAALHAAFERILELRFEDCKLETVLEDVKHAAVRLASMQGRTHAEIAAILGCSRATVGNWLGAAADSAQRQRPQDGGGTAGDAA